MGLRFTVFSLRFTITTLFCMISLITIPQILFGQAKTTSFGFVVKPIFPSSFFRTGPQTQTVDSANVTFRLAQISGFSAGAVVRKGITNNLSLETGIQYVKRVYSLKITDTTFTESSYHKIIGYEVPLQVLVFVQLSRQIWMNASLGTSVDIFPSDINTRSAYFKHLALRKSNLSVFNAGLIANIGWEFRTEKDGIIYLGSSYHRSFKDIYISKVEYYRNGKSGNQPITAKTDFNLKGDYLTLDLRYYFAGDMNKKKKKK